MTDADLAAWNAHFARVNAMSDEEVGTLIHADKCPYEPEHLRGVPLGMHHCPLCGEMVVAALPHPRKPL